MLAGTETLGIFERDTTIRSRLAGFHAEGMRQMVKQFVAATEGTANTAADPQSAATSRGVLLEVAVKRERVLNLGGMQFQKLGNFHDRPKRHIAKLFVDDMQ